MADEAIDQAEAEKLAEKFKKGKGFDLEDFKGQIQQMKKMGGLASLVDKLPAQIAQMAAGSPKLAACRRATPQHEPRAYPRLRPVNTGFRFSMNARTPSA